MQVFTAHFGKCVLTKCIHFSFFNLTFYCRRNYPLWIQPAAASMTQRMVDNLGGSSVTRHISSNCSVANKTIRLLELWPMFRKCHEIILNSKRLTNVTHIYLFDQCHAGISVWPMSHGCSCLANVMQVYTDQEFQISGQIRKKTEHSLSQAIVFMQCIVLYCTVLYFAVLYCNVLYCIALYCIVLYCIVLYCIVLYCIVL